MITIHRKSSNDMYTLNMFLYRYLNLYVLCNKFNVQRASTAHTQIFFIVFLNVGTEKTERAVFLTIYVT